MAEVVRFLPKGADQARPVVAEPYVHRLVAQGNAERAEIASKAAAEIKRERARMERLNRTLAETRGELRKAESEFFAKCGGARHVPPIGPAVFWTVAAVLAVGDFAVAYELLDYLGIKGHPRPDAAFASYFSEAGPVGGSLAAFSDYANEKFAVALALAVGTVTGAKVTGTWIRQRPARRPQSLSGWAVAAWNCSFAFLVGGFAFVREAQVAGQGIAELGGMWPVFVAVQGFAYGATVLLAAFAADPDPEAKRLSVRIGVLKEERERAWRERQSVSERCSRLWSQASSAADSEAHRILGMVAAYRDGNFASRPPGSPPPPYMAGRIGPEVFAPLPLDPLPDPAAAPAFAEYGGNDTVVHRQTY